MKNKLERKPKIISPGKGRTYKMGRINSTFLADNEETNHSYSVSEWWLDPNTKGPGIHDHKDDHVFYILEGIMHIYLKNKWHECIQGTYIIIPGHTPHDFENRHSKRSGILSFNNKSGFENQMPEIQNWFAENPPEKIL